MHTVDTPSTGNFLNCDVHSPKTRTITWSTLTSKHKSNISIKIFFKGNENSLHPKTKEKFNLTEVVLLNRDEEL